MTSTRRSRGRARTALVLLLACAFAAGPSDTRAADGAAVRLNTVGYLPSHAKRATLAATLPETRREDRERR